MFDQIFQNVSIETVVYYVLALVIYAALFIWLSRRMTTSRTEMRRDARSLIAENLSLMESMKRVRGEMEDDEQRGELDQMWTRLLRETSGRIEELNNDEERVLADPSEQYLLLPPPLTAFGAMLSVIFVAAVFFAGATFLYILVNIANAELDPVTRAEDLRYGLQIAGVGLAAIGLAFLARFAAYQSFKARARKLRSRIMQEVIEEKIAEKKQKPARGRAKKQTAPEEPGDGGGGGVETIEASDDAKTTSRRGGLGRLKLRKAASAAKSEPIAPPPTSEPPVDSGESVRRVPREQRATTPQEPKFDDPPMGAQPRQAPTTAADPRRQDPRATDPRMRATEPTMRATEAPSDAGPPQTARFRQTPQTTAQQPGGQTAAPRASAAGGAGLLGAQGAPASGAGGRPASADGGASVPSTQRPAIDPEWQKVLGQSQDPAGGQGAPTQRPTTRNPNAPDDDGKA